mmetsp:Transcript_19494/g.29958  ORF Transcript_19494/g.29958 Transcript_19494/m.29958 type:complete len:329 (-) Transcript_19494:41-1027(-)|eukprot:CAMPEP_0170481450 /NCGR_PEP_ID=MMETSP0208-20121228/1890_1 /TAXON_ID=197538 /ORGANISM="Strombidium inclinatum, Strain S3" /LENGTH=328 /DNA_ID=CAMNT_0010754153 /DNA_START=130 /DNA_END=1116 /DNA_ORIENTATION=-
MANLTTGYVHPYHSSGAPIYMSNMYFMKSLFSAVGPEQVSPHYESLSRSRRGLLFFALYIGSINTISRFGGWEHNDWLRGMIWHHEFLIAFYLGYIEIRHFTYFMGPKFSIFYNVYSSYELQQMSNAWADQAEMTQNQHLRFTKQQIEYNRIDQEYEFVKKRSLVNFLTNSKINAEAHFHQRTIAMLNSVQAFEQANLKTQMKNLAVGSVDKVLTYVNHPNHAEEMRRSSFENALDGIKTGVMTYKNDKILPMIEDEMADRLRAFQGLSAEEESQLLTLTVDQKKIIGDNDRKMKEEFLTQAPTINHGSVKMNQKYKDYMEIVQTVKQ